MSESDPTGYGDSPDTTDGPVEDDQQDDGQAQRSGPDAPLTTDDDAQRDDLPTRGGNEAG